MAVGPLLTSKNMSTKSSAFRCRDIGTKIADRNIHEKKKILSVSRLKKLEKGALAAATLLDSPRSSP